MEKERLQMTSSKLLKEHYSAYQEADRALFKISVQLILARETRSQFRIQNEAAQLLLVDITLRIQALRSSVALIDIRAPSSDFVPHGLFMLKDSENTRKNVISAYSKQRLPATTISFEI